MHINKWHTGSNPRGCRPLKAKEVHNKWLVTQKKDEVEQHQAPLASKGEIGND